MPDVPSPGSVWLYWLDAAGPNDSREAVSAAPASRLDATHVSPSNGKLRHRRIDLEALHDADAVLGLDRQAVERHAYEVALRLGRAKRRRAGLINTRPEPTEALVDVAGVVAWLG